MNFHLNYAMQAQPVLRIFRAVSGNLRVARAAWMLLCVGLVFYPPSSSYAAPRQASATSPQAQKTKTAPANPGPEIITIPATSGQFKAHGKPHVMRGAWPQLQCSVSIVERAAAEAERGTTPARTKYLVAQATAAARGLPVTETCKDSVQPPAGVNHAAILHALTRYRTYLPRLTARLSADARVMAKVKRDLPQTCTFLLELELEREHFRTMALTSNASDKVKSGLINSLPDPKGLRNDERALEESGAKTQADLEAIGKANEQVLRDPSHVDAVLSQFLQSKIGAHAGSTFGPGCHLGAKAKGSP